MFTFHAITIHPPYQSTLPTVVSDHSCWDKHNSILAMHISYQAKEEVISCLCLVSVTLVSCSAFYCCILYSYWKKKIFKHLLCIQHCYTYRWNCYINCDIESPNISQLLLKSKCYKAHTEFWNLQNLPLLIICKATLA